MAFLTGVDTTLINQIEPSLASYYPTGSSDWVNQLGIAKRFIINELRNNRRDVKKYLTPLYLVEDDTTTLSGATYTGDQSDEDTLARTIWVTDVSAVSGTTPTIHLQGTNVESPASTDWYYIPNRESVAGYTTTNSLSTGTLTANLRSIQKLEDTYKYYRIIGTFTTAKIKSYLVEGSFHYAHLYKTLQIIFQMLVASDDNTRWDEKAKMYEQMYQMEMSNMVSAYDNDGDGTLEDGEGLHQVNERRFYR